MSIENALAAHAEALNKNSEAMLALAAAMAAGGGNTTITTSVTKTDTKDSTDDKKAAADKKPTAAEKKAADAAAKKAAAEAAKKNEVTDERLTEVFGPLLAKTLDADQLAANKAFVATVNAHFGVTKLRELASQEDRAQAVEWGLARAEDGEFEIPGDDEDAI